MADPGQSPTGCDVPMTPRYPLMRCRVLLYQRAALACSVSGACWARAQAAPAATKVETTVLTALISTELASTPPNAETVSLSQRLRWGVDSTALRVAPLSPALGRAATDAFALLLACIAGKTEKGGTRPGTSVACRGTGSLNSRKELK